MLCDLTSRRSPFWKLSLTTIRFGPPSLAWQIGNLHFPIEVTDSRDTHVQTIPLSGRCCRRERIAWRPATWRFFARSSPQGMRTITDSFADWLPALLQLSDAAFPTGSYAHSYGLEEIVRQGAVCDEESLREFLRRPRHCRLSRMSISLSFGRHVPQPSAGDRDDLLPVDRLAGALRIPRELREASLQTGRRRLAILIRLRPTPELEALSQIILGGSAAPVITPSFGASHALHLPSSASLGGLLLSFRLVSLHSRSEAHSHRSGGNPARADSLSEPTRSAASPTRSKFLAARDWLVRSAARYCLHAP